MHDKGVHHFAELKGDSQIQAVKTLGGWWGIFKKRMEQEVAVHEMESFLPN